MRGFQNDENKQNSHQSYFTLKFKNNRIQKSIYWQRIDSRCYNIKTKPPFSQAPPKIFIKQNSSAQYHQEIKSFFPSKFIKKTMEAYKQLLSEFHSQQTSIIEQDCHTKYIQLLNQVKINRERNCSAKKKCHFQFQSLKTTNQDFYKSSRLKKSMQTSRLDYLNNNLEQKTSMIGFQRQSLLQQVDYLKAGLSKLKREKNMIEDQIYLIDKKETEIVNVLFESEKNIGELKILIKQQKDKNDKEYICYDSKIQQMTKQLQKINEANILNARFYKQSNEEKNQNNNKTLLGTILMWQSEESKLKKMSKKTYTKHQIQSLMRTLYLILKFSEINYGNIIQHLIEISENKKQKVKSQKNIYLNFEGQEIKVKALIQKLQKDILTECESKFLSKTKIIEFYIEKGVEISSDFQHGGLSQQTKVMISRVLAHFSKLTSWFSRIQKRNVQLSQNYNSLIRVDEELSNQIKQIQNSAAQKSINYLQSREQEILSINQKLINSCKVIFQFNMSTYDLIRRFQNINKFFDKIVKSTNRRTYKKTYIQSEDERNFLIKITKILFKSPQCIILDWNNAIKGPLTSNFISSSESLQKMPQNQTYLETIMKNDLLRIYAEPSMFDISKSYLDNTQRTFNYVINQEKHIITKLASILKDLLLFSKNGIHQFQSHQIQLREQRKLSALLKDKQTNDKLNPLLKILQLNNSKLGTFFVKDQIKEVQKPESEHNFCIQSNEYYRRDNFRLIQKIQKLDLKKRGLLTSLPFMVNTSLQLQPLQTTLDGTSFDKQNLRLGSTRNSYRRRQPRLSHQLLQSRHNELSERRQKQNSRKKQLKDLLKNISNIASQNQKYRIRKKLNSQEKQFSTLTPKLM